MGTILLLVNGSVMNRQNKIPPAIIHLRKDYSARGVLGDAQLFRGLVESQVWEEALPGPCWGSWRQFCAVQQVLKMFFNFCG